MRKKEKNYVGFEKNDYKEKFSEKKILEWINKVLNELNLENSYCSVYFASNKTIKNLNKKYLKKDYATDVLSFSQIEGEKADFIRSDFLGDIVISIPYAKKQAENNNNVFINEIYMLLLHGILHLQGYDHESDDNGLMLKKQNKLFKKLYLKN